MIRVQVLSRGPAQWSQLRARCVQYRQLDGVFAGEEFEELEPSFDKTHKLVDATEQVYEFDGPG